MIWLAPTARTSTLLKAAPSLTRKAGKATGTTYPKRIGTRKIVCIGARGVMVKYSSLSVLSVERRMYVVFSTFPFFKSFDALELAEDTQYVSDPVDSQPTDNQTMSEDRETNPRCTAPLLDIPLSGLIVPVKYQERDGGSEEYHQLLRRGATRIMCEQFSLSFSHERGIFAWANQDLFDEFSGEAMKEGDQWLIYLGRRIELDEEDVDGTDFIEGLLEDGALFAPDPCKWSTVKEGPNLWVTRPNLEIYEVDWDDEERDTANDLEEDDPRLENLNKNSAAEASPIENAYDAGDDDDMETSSVYTESSAEETDDEEGAADLCLYEVGISINTHGPDMDWEDDESSEGQSDTAASYEQDFDTDA